MPDSAVEVLQGYREDGLLMEDWIMQFDPLGWFFDFMEFCLSPFFNFLLGFLPDGDEVIYGIIDGVANMGSALTFNIFWFIDWGAVGVCLGVLIACIFAVSLCRFVNNAIGLASKAIEKVPIVQ